MTKDPTIELFKKGIFQKNFDRKSAIAIDYPDFPLLAS